MKHQNIVKFERYHEDEQFIYILLELCNNNVKFEDISDLRWSPSSQETAYLGLSTILFSSNSWGRSIYSLIENNSSRSQTLKFLHFRPNDHQNWRFWTRLISLHQQKKKINMWNTKLYGPLNFFQPRRLLLWNRCLEFRSNCLSITRRSFPILKEWYAVNKYST